MFWRDVLPVVAAVSALNSKHESDTYLQEEEGGNSCKTQILQQSRSRTVAHLKIPHSVLSE